jgi:DNA-binding MarR family transcriptional regulator
VKIRFRFEEPEESPGFLLWQVSMLWERRQRALLEPFGLTHTQFVLLATTGWLQRAGEPVTQTAIARQAKVDVMMTSQVLRTLEERGLLARAPHPADTRAKAITLTPAGEKLVTPALAAVEREDARFFAPLGPRQPAFLAALRTLVRAEEEKGSSA